MTMASMSGQVRTSENDRVAETSGYVFFEEMSTSYEASQIISSTPNA